MRGAENAERSGFGPEGTGSLSAILGHDLANHLQIIDGHADLLLDDVEEPTAVDRLMAIKRQTVAANSLVQTVCGIEDAPSRAEFDVVDLGELLEEEVQHLRSAYRDADVTADVSSNIAVRADGLLASVFRNLLQNAVQHNDSAAPHVAVTARSTDSEATVVIEDDGPGLPDPVRQALLGEAPARPGSGVGIVRALTDRYDGTITVESSEAGTRVAVEFPRAPRSKDS